MREGPRAARTWCAAGLAVLVAALAPTTACVLSTEGQATAAPPRADAGAPDAGDDPADAATGPERCENDVDDDGDDLVDCADPDCQPDYACVDTPPESWEGPLWIRDVAWDDPATPCRDGTAPRSHPTGDPGTASCTPCSCGEVEGATCEPPRLVCLLGGVDCYGGVETDLTAEAAAVACMPEPAQGDQSTCRTTGTAMVSSQGGCARHGGDLVPTPPVSGRVDRCTSPTRLGDCPPGRACARRPAPDYADHGVCIQRSGAFQGCPASFPDARVLVWQEMSDGRGCDACSCDAKGSSCAGGGYTYFACLACGACTTLDVTPACLPTSAYGPTGWSIAATPPTLVKGSCEPSGGAPHGEVHVEGQLTFCCKR